MRSMGRHAGREGVESAPGPQGRGAGAGPALHRPPPRARGHQSAGVRRAPPRRPPVRRPDLTVATEDHNVPTLDVLAPIADPVSRTQVETLRKNCAEFGVPLYPMGDAEQGIVHVVGPQLGLTQPGMTVVCGDSHTSTHGAFGALAFGIGTSEVEHVLATQTLPLRPFKTMAINVNSNTAGCAPASRARTSSSRSSRRSAPAAARATCWSTGATPSRTSRWKPG